MAQPDQLADAKAQFDRDGFAHRKHGRHAELAKWLEMTPAQRLQIMSRIAPIKGKRTDGKVFKACMDVVRNDMAAA